MEADRAEGQHGRHEDAQDLRRYVLEHLPGIHAREQEGEETGAHREWKHPFQHQAELAHEPNCLHSSPGYSPHFAKIGPYVKVAATASTSRPSVTQTSRERASRPRVQSARTSLA